MNEPVADAVRGILDGHIVLERNLAQKGHYPAIDVLHSVSRVMDQVASSEQRQAALNVKRMLSTYREAEDLINIGAYKPGSNPSIDTALKYIDNIHAFTRQDTFERSSLSEAVQQLTEQFKELS
jgi:flagellum-specific ATP synthase